MCPTLKSLNVPYAMSKSISDIDGYQIVMNLISGVSIINMMVFFLMQIENMNTNYWNAKC